MKNTTKKALKAMLILAMLVTLCMSLAACAQTTETGTTDPIVLELVFQPTRPLRGATAKVYKSLCTFLR